MSDITASERRLSAALDRMDQLLDAGRGASGPQAERIAALERERDAALARADGAGAEPALAELQARLDAATEEAAALSAANEALIAANRDLLEAQQTGGIGPDEARAALEAELSALRAARAAEMAQMSEIMAELERLLADEPAVIDGPSPGASEDVADDATDGGAGAAEGQVVAEAGSDARHGSDAGPRSAAATGPGHGPDHGPDAGASSGAGRSASTPPTPQQEDR